MKNLKSIFAMLAMVTVMGVSSSFGGVYIIDRSATQCVQDNGSSQGTGIMLGVEGIMIGGRGLEGIMIGGLEGIMIGGKSDTPCTEGIMIGG